MEFKAIGTLIKEIRASKNITRKQLSYGICSEHTLQELESDNYAADGLMPDIINQIFGVAYLFFAAILVFRGNITTGVLLMGYQYLGYFSSPISGVCGILMRYRSNKVHIERVDELTLDAEKPNELAAYQTEETAVFTANDFDFYKGDQPEDFLYHIPHMEISKNGLYVIKGNGSGKSMLMNLILGNITPQNCKGNFSVSKDIFNDYNFLDYAICIICFFNSSIISRGNSV